MLNKIFKYLLVAILFLANNSFAQEIESSSIILNRGKLWQTIGFGKIGPTFGNWNDNGIGLDWPAFDASLIAENIGGSPSYMVTGGLYVGALRSDDSVLTVEDWSIYGGSISEEATSKYVVKRHKRLYPDGSNNWLVQNPGTAEEVVETIWEYNTIYSDSFSIRRQLPIRVTRHAYQWSGSKLDENYILYEYTIKNISPELRQQFPTNNTRFIADTLYNFLAMLNYGMHANSRSWGVLFPSLTSGARNTWFYYDPSYKMIFGFADDYLGTTQAETGFGLASSFGPQVNGKPSGEYLAPGYVGVRLIYASPNKQNRVTQVKEYGWSAGSNSIDLSGPFNNKGSQESQYEVLNNIRSAASYVRTSTDSLMRKSRMWSMMTMGPWDILPGDSIKIVYAELVDGVDYEKAVNPTVYKPKDISDGILKFYDSADRAKFTYDNNYQHNDPPVAPSFTVDFNDQSESVANLIIWGSEAESIPDPDTQIIDIEGYILYRSDYLPIGPWKPVDTVKVGDPQFLNGFEYEFLDSTVEIGKSYYYALTAYDNTDLETSIYANRMQIPFIATLAPRQNLDEVLVVPNPFILGEGFSRPGESDKIQFVNIPNPCTIRIFTVRGDLVKTINVEEGDGAIVSWDQITDFGQFVESGVYVFHIESQVGTKIGKFAIVR